MPPRLELLSNHRRALFLLCLGGLTVAACDCDDGVPRPCETANPPAACGTACTDDGACAGATYCGDDGTCTADCAPGDGNCGSGQVCDPDDGRCIADPGGGGGGGGGAGGGTGGGAGGGDGGACENLSVTADPIEPYIVFIIDRSGTMDEEYPSGSGVVCDGPDEGQTGDDDECLNRWDSLRSVLVGAASGPLAGTGVIDQFQSVAHIGVVQYTGDGDDDQPNTDFNGETWPLLIETPAALDNLAAIAADYDATIVDRNDPDNADDDVLTNPPGNGDTPTGESMWMALCHLDLDGDTNYTTGPGCESYYDHLANTEIVSDPTPPANPAEPLVPATRDPNAPVIFILATDGIPDSSFHPDPNSCQTSGPEYDGEKARRLVLQAAREARTLPSVDAAFPSIQTYVISVNEATDQNRHLADVACEGGTGPHIANNPCNNNDDSEEEDCTNPSPASGPGLIEAFDADALRNELQGIIGSNIPCDFQLEAMVDVNTVDEARAEGEVTIDGVPVPLASGGVGNGWWLEDDGITFRLLGTACDDFQANPGAALVANFTCDSGVIIIPL